MTWDLEAGDRVVLVNSRLAWEERAPRDADAARAQAEALVAPYALALWWTAPG